MDKAATLANRKAGSRATGIFPFRKWLVKDHAFAARFSTNMEFYKESTGSNELVSDTPSVDSGKTKIKHKWQLQTPRTSIQDSMSPSIEAVQTPENETNSRICIRNADVNTTYQMIFKSNK